MSRSPCSSATGGTLQPPRHSVVGRSPGEVETLDLDNDGTLDLLVSNLLDDHVSLLVRARRRRSRAAPLYAGVPAP